MHQLLFQALHVCFHFQHKLTTVTLNNNQALEQLKQSVRYVSATGLVLHQLHRISSGKNAVFCVNSPAEICEHIRITTFDCGLL